MDADEVMVFKVKRLSEAENSEILDRQLAIKDLKDMTAEELMQSEINTYNAKVAEKQAKAEKKAAKIAEDKAKREAETKAKQEGISES